MVYFQKNQKQLPLRMRINLHLMDPHLMDPHLMDLHLMDLHLMDLHLMDSQRILPEEWQEAQYKEGHFSLQQEMSMTVSPPWKCSN